MREFTPDSTNVKHVSWSETGDLRVEFHCSGTYVYHNVPEHVFDLLLHSDSVGKALNQNVKGSYEFTQEANVAA